MSIDLDSGKYHFHESGHTLCCRRYGMKWRNFIGDKAVHRLFGYAEELVAENAKLKEKNNYLASLMQDIRNCSDSEQVQSLLDVRAEKVKLKAELEKHRWIPVEERLPEKSGHYLTLGQFSTIPQTTKYRDNWWSALDAVTHWKPVILPEPK